MGAGGAFCRVTTRSPNSRPVLAFRRRLGPLTARLLGGGVLPLHFGSLAPLGLSATSLPAPKKTAALRVLAIALIPTPWLIPLTASSTMADSRTRFAPAGLGACFCSRLAGAHGRSCSQGSARGRGSVFLGHFHQVKETKVLQSSGAGEADEKQDAFRNVRLKGTRKECSPSGLPQTIENGPDSKIGPSRLPFFRKREMLPGPSRACG
jgi:hypothetical protein